MHMHMHTHTHIHTHTHTHTHTQMHRKCTCMHTHTHMHARKVYMCTHAHTCKQVPTHARTTMHASIHSRVLNGHSVISTYIISLVYRVASYCIIQKLLFMVIIFNSRLKYIILLKLPIILSGNSFNFYLLFPKLFPTFYHKYATKTTILYL